MIYLFWPRKQIPRWLEDISFCGVSNGAPRADHGGFGVVVRRKGVSYVWLAWGNFMVIDTAGMALKVSAGGSGALICLSLPSWLTAVVEAK